MSTNLGYDPNNTMRKELNKQAPVYSKRGYLSRMNKKEEFVKKEDSISSVSEIAMFQSDKESRRLFHIE